MSGMLGSTSTSSRDSASPTTRRARIVARELVAARVNVMLRLLDERDADMRARLNESPLGELNTWADIEVKFIDPAATSADCSIAGAYIDTVEPPIIGIIEGSYSRREAFTVLHELGHYLQRTELELAKDLPSQADRGRILEEMTSDAFAAAILIPAELAAKHLGDKTPSASDVRRLWLEANASRAAVCVRAAQNLSSPGHVVLLDQDGVIAFSASYADYPLRAGLDQSQTSIVRSARTSAAGLISGKTTWQYANGSFGQELYAQATRLGDYILVVSVVDGAPWEQLALSAPSRTYYKEWHTCVSCGHPMRIYGFTTCSICDDPKCPECGRCACPSRVAERTCTECFLVRPAQFFTGDSTVCDDC